MATYGSVKTTAYDSRYLEFYWEVTNQDIANNKTTIKWTLTARGTGQYSQYNAAPFKVTIDTTQIYYSDTRIITKNGTQIANGTHTFTHNTDGTKSFSVYVQGAIYVYAYNVSGSGTFTLDAIPRAATISSVTWANDEATPVIKFTNPAGVQATKFEFFLQSNEYTGRITTKEVTNSMGLSSYTMTLTTSERQEVWKVFNDRKVVDTYFYFGIITTLANGTVMERKFLLSSCKLINYLPTVSISFALDDKTQNKIGGTTPILNYTNLTYTITATAKKGATITSYYFENYPYTNTAATGTFLITWPFYKYSATDSRGDTASDDNVLDVYDYKALTCNQSVNIELVGETSATATIDITGTYYNGTIGTTQNTLALYCRYCEDTQDINNVAWVYIGTHQTISNSEYKTTHIIKNLDYTKGYKIQCSAQDFLLSRGTNVYNSKVLPVFDWSGSDFNFNVPVSMYGVEQDYIVEQGDKDGWTYRKWNSGLGECWKTISYTTTVTGAWGGLYQSGYIARQNYPFAFIEKPVENVSCVAGGGGGWICPADAANGGTNGAYASAVYIIIRPTAATNYQTYYVNYQIIGKWK